MLAPMEATKVRIQTAPDAPPTLRGCCPMIWRTEGIMGFYKGKSTVCGVLKATYMYYRYVFSSEVMKIVWIGCKRDACIDAQKMFIRSKMEEDERRGKNRLKEKTQCNGNTVIWIADGSEDLTATFIRHKWRDSVMISRNISSRFMRKPLTLRRNAFRSTPFPAIWLSSANRSHAAIKHSPLKSGEHF